MLKFQNNEGETVFELKDDASKPKKCDDCEDCKCVKAPCDKCNQTEDKTGEYPCPECGRSLLHDEDQPEEEVL
jgi:hypothetical protein